MAAEEWRVIQEDCECFFKTLKNEFQESRCNFCFKLKLGLQLCKGCKAVFYCNEGCQKLDVKYNHAMECCSSCFQYCSSSWAKEDQVPLFRLYARTKADPHFRKRQHRMADGSKMCFDDLPSNYPIWVKCRKTQGICADLVRRLKKEDPSATIAEFVCLNGVLITNALPIIDNGVVIGQGLFVFRSPAEALQKPVAIMKEGRFQIWAVMPNPTNPTVFPLFTRFLQVMYGDQAPQRKSTKEQEHFTQIWCAQQTNPSWEPIDYVSISELSATLSSAMADFRPNTTPLNVARFQETYNQLMALLVEAKSVRYDTNVAALKADYAIFAKHLELSPQEIRRLVVDALTHLDICFGRLNGPLYRKLYLMLRALPF